MTSLLRIANGIVPPAGYAHGLSGETKRSMPHAICECCLNAMASAVNDTVDQKTNHHNLRLQTVAVDALVRFLDGNSSRRRLFTWDTDNDKLDIAGQWVPDVVAAKRRVVDALAARLFWPTVSKDVALQLAAELFLVQVDKCTANAAQFTETVSIQNSDRCLCDSRTTHRMAGSGPEVTK